MVRDIRHIDFKCELHHAVERKGSFEGQIQIVCRLTPEAFDRSNTASITWDEVFRAVANVIGLSARRMVRRCGTCSACAAVEYGECIWIDVLDLTNIVGIVRIPAYVGTGRRFAVVVLATSLSSNNTGHACAQ